LKAEYFLENGRFWRVKKV